MSYPLILTIDDESAIRDSFCHYLEDLNYQVLQACDGQQGILKMETAQPDLVLVDLRMPDSDGLDVLRWAKTQAPLTPIIVVSGTGVISDVIEALQLGAWDYLLKPVNDLEMLRLAIERALEKSYLRRQAANYQQRLQREVAQRTQELLSANRELNIAASAFNTHDAILITDAQGNIIRANAAAERLTGYSQDELIGKSPSLFKSGKHDEAFYNALWETLHTTGQWQGEMWNRSRDGNTYPIWQSITAVRGDSDSVAYYVGVSTDLSELKAKERMLEHRAQEERVLGSIANLAMKFMDSEPFIRQALQLLQQQLPDLGLLSHVQLWHNDAQAWKCRDILSLQGSVITPPPSKQLALAAQSNDAVTSILEGTIRYFLIPLCSQRRDLGVLVLCSDVTDLDDAVEPFLVRLGEVLPLAMLHQESERELHYQANHDSLTALPNRQSLKLLLEQQISSARRRNERGVVLFLDLDNFKTLNDSLGHSQGDLLLQQLGARVRTALRDEDILARLGGDEFVILLPPRPLESDDTLNMAAHVAEKIKKVINRPFQLDVHEYMVGCSIGVAIFPDAGNSSEELLKHADIAMYLAKAAGRNSVRFYSPGLQQAADRRLYLEHKLRRAISQSELEPYFQPQLNHEGQVIGAEVLLRWHNSEDGWVSPAEFIPVAEESGLIIPISNWLLGEVCQCMKHWRDLGLFEQLKTVSINVSPNQFYQPDFAEMVLNVIKRFDISPETLMLEITEGVVLCNLEDSIEIMRNLGQQGVRFSLDDFGTGYSSLAYLKKLPVDEIKIDKSFILEIDKNPDDVMIVDAILSLASHFELTTVAEGVETQEALTMLRDRQCAVYQGFYFSRPLPEGEFLAFLSQGQSMLKDDL